MSAIEQAIVALVQQTVRQMLAGAQEAQTTQLVAHQNAPQVVQVQPAADPFAGLGGPAPAPVAVQITPQMVQELIMPYIQNEQYKQLFSAEMLAMGIVNIGDTPVERYPELYQRFQGVAARINASAQQAQVQQPTQQQAATII